VSEDRESGELSKESSLRARRAKQSSGEMAGEKSTKDNEINILDLIMFIRHWETQERKND
jgi:hypothetical protein